MISIGDGRFEAEHRTCHPVADRQERNALVQLVRFALVGGASNIMYVLVFFMISDHGSQFANAVGALLSTVLANELHRRLTFCVADRVGWFTAQWQCGGLAVAGLVLSAMAIAALGNVVPDAGSFETVVMVIAVNAVVGGLRFLVLRGSVFRTIQDRF